MTTADHHRHNGVDVDLLLDVVTEAIAIAHGDVDLVERAVRIASAPGEWARLRAMLEGQRS